MLLCLDNLHELPRYSASPRWVVGNVFETIAHDIGRFTMFIIMHREVKLRSCSGKLRTLADMS